MRLTFVWQDAKDKRTRCEQLALTAESQEDLESLSRLAALFTTGEPAGEVARHLAERSRMVVVPPARAGDFGAPPGGHPARPEEPAGPTPPGEKPPFDGNTPWAGEKRAAFGRETLPGDPAKAAAAEPKGGDV